MNVLILEDDPERMKLFKVMFVRDQMDHAPNAKQAKEFLSQNQYDLVMLDHDLNDKHLANPDNMNHEGTGQDVAKFMARMKNPPPFAFVHSWNPPGAKAIAKILKEADINHYVAQFNTADLGRAVSEYRRKFNEG